MFRVGVNHLLPIQVWRRWPPSSWASSRGGRTLLERFPDLEKTLAGAGFTPLTAALLALAIPPAVVLLHRFRRSVNNF